MTISNFSKYFLETDEVYPVVLKPKTDPDSYINIQQKREARGIQWEYDGETFRLMREGHSLSAMPSPKMDKVLVVYPPNDKFFGAPRNLVIHNPDGTIHCRPQAPTLKSPNDKPPHLESVAAECCNAVAQWHQYDDQFMVLIELEMNQTGYVEFQEIDPYTGQYGEFSKAVRIRYIP